MVIAALLCISSIRAGPSVTFFYPQSFTETSCTGSASWTKWFNSAKPSDNGNLDKEVLSVIRAQNGRDTCEKPQALQAQSVGQLTSGSSFGCSWSTMNNIIAEFRSTTPGLDYQVRFCCANSDFAPTTTTTTTPRPITSATCGRAEIKHSLRSSLRIVGGSHAVSNSWPWQVLYEEKKPCENNRICLGVCGGTLIDSRHVLTAAHCIGTNNPSAITITAGLHNKKNNEDATQQKRTVERIFMHPGYNNKTIENDITILRLAQPVQFNKYVQPACLPGPDPKSNDSVVLIGWGATQVGGAAYHELKQTKVKVIGNCQQHWGFQVDEEKQICVGDIVTGDSACQGDSGGPMLYEHNGQWVVAGVTSYVQAGQCSTSTQSKPNVYARVSAYLPWIKSII
ncbi:unnamed protein product [Adineta steineri]|uniref:Peptidase S1 domain-containing protein n=1 Tax=Adineta steineri TaxID=433720 RepID=A0A815ASR5_9BILA|nr:unnamed protein product [Adineta steineri]CAF1546805.1 unnamed protein product [Adineta steineri]